MDSGIFLVQADNSLMRMNQQPYEAEERLQELLADHSDLLAGDQINSESPRRWLFIGREMGVPGEEGGSDQWSLDHLFIDQDAVPTFVEVKRSSDTRSRREVVAQMLDYAANAVTYWPVSRMRERHAVMCESSGIAADEHILQFIGEDGGIEEYWALADLNLRSGRVRMLFVSDNIPPSLRRIVEFLNQQMNPAEVLALEVKQYVGLAEGSQLRTLVPRVIGQTEATRELKRTGMAGGKPRETVAVEDFSSLPDVHAYRPEVEQLLQLGSSSQFEMRPKAFPKSNEVGFVVPGSNGNTFALTTDRLFWINFQTHERTSDPALKEEIKAILLPVFPKKKNVIERSIALNTFFGLPFDQIASESGLDAIERVIRLVEVAIFGDQASLVSESENGS